MRITRLLVLVVHVVVVVLIGRFNGRYGGFGFVTHDCAPGFARGPLAFGSGGYRPAGGKTCTEIECPALPGRARSLALFRLYFSSRPAAMRSPITGPPVKGARQHPSIQLPGLPDRAREPPKEKYNRRFR